MRVFSRFALVLVVVVLSAVPSFANHQQADCPMTLVASNPPSTNFNQSPAGAFRFGQLVFVLRGQTLATYSVNDLGELQLAREDFIGSLASRETNGGVAFANGLLYVSGEGGLEIYDLRGVRPGGAAPQLLSRTPGLHYRRMAVSGNLLAGLYPATDMPCHATPFSTSCLTQVDLINVGNTAAPFRAGSVNSFLSATGGFNDIAFNAGNLFVTGLGGTVSYNVSNPAALFTTGTSTTGGTFLISNGANLLAVGNDVTIEVQTVQTNGAFAPFATYVIPFYLTIDRANPIRFARQGAFDEAQGRLITMIEEVNPLTNEAARTIAFDIFDFNVPGYEGSVQRLYESLSMVVPDEVKHAPVAVGPYVYVVGEMSGLQTYGACGQVAGQIEFDTLSALNCGGSELHGWVTGDQRIVNVELFLDGGSLGSATLGGVPRTDIFSRTPVTTWRINVNLDATPRGEHVLRAVGTDARGNRRQFSSQRVFFPGPGNNCTNRRRTTGGR